VRYFRLVAIDMKNIFNNLLDDTFFRQCTITFTKLFGNSPICNSIFAELYIILIFAANCLQKGGRDTGAGLTLSTQNSRIIIENPLACKVN
jgi:hypothetical protein